MKLLGVNCNGNNRSTLVAVTLSVQLRSANSKSIPDHKESNTRDQSLSKHVSSERCAELTTVAAAHGLKEAWISFQIGENRLDAEASKGNADGWKLFFGRKKKTP